MNTLKRVFFSGILILCVQTNYAQETQFNLFRMFNGYILYAYETLCSSGGFEEIYGFSIKEFVQAIEYLSLEIFEDSSKIDFDVDYNNEMVLVPDFIIKTTDKDHKIYVTGGALLLNFFISALGTYKEYSMEQGLEADIDWTIPVLARVINNNWTFDKEEGDVVCLMKLLDGTADLVLADKENAENSALITRHTGIDSSLIFFSLFHELAHLSAGQKDKMPLITGGSEELRCDLIALTLFIIVETQNPDLALDMDSVLFFFKILYTKERDETLKAELQERYNFIREYYPKLKDSDY
jgi:hypothetical protein